MKKGKFFSVVTARAGLPSESFPGVPLIEIFGQDRVLVENHSCIIGYSSELVEIKVCYGVVRVFGNDLMLSCADREQLIIHGKIRALELDRRT